MQPLVLRCVASLEARVDGEDGALAGKREEEGGGGRDLGGCRGHPGNINVTQMMSRVGERVGEKP